MSESAEFAVDASVAPCRDLRIEAQDELAKLGRCRSPTGARRLVWVGPAAGDEATVPAEHGFGFDDQEDLGEAFAVEGLGEHGEHGAIGWCEPRLLDLALKHAYLVSESEDLSDTVISRNQQQSHTFEREADQPRRQLSQLLFHPPQGRTRKPSPTCCDEFSAPSRISEPHRRANVLVSAHARVFERHRAPQVIA